MSRVALIIGHYVYGKDKGATAFTGESESLYNFRVATKVRDVLFKNGVEVKIFTRDEYKTFLNIANGIKGFGARLCIEMHFNAFAKAALGCECLSLIDDQDSISFADLLTDKIAEVMQVTERHKTGKTDGVLLIGKGGRGYNNLKIVKDVNKSIPVVLVEPCFANIRTKESEKFFLQENSYVESLVVSVQSWLKATAVKSVNASKLPVSPKNAVERVMNSVRGDYK